MIHPSPNVVAHSAYGPIILNVNDLIVGRDITRCGYWNMHELVLVWKLIKLQIKKKDTIMFYDVGAYVGTYSLALSKIFKECIRIRAFEAQRPIYNMLCGTMALNDIHNVRCHLLAVSDRDGEKIEIDLPDYAEPNNFGGLELLAPKNSDNIDMIKKWKARNR